MQKRMDLTGNRYGRLIVIGEADTLITPKGRKIYRWHCKCDCGGSSISSTTSLRKGKTKSCGCIHREIISKDITGQRFGRLVAVNRESSNSRGDAMWFCKCDCGGVNIVKQGSLSSGATKSCGCLQKEAGEKQGKLAKRHGMTNTRLYNIWTTVKYRTSDKSTGKARKDYYSRGIRICEEWRNSFENFMTWAINSGYSDDLQIDRIDNEGNYTPDNCHWVDKYTNAQNRRMRPENRSGVHGVAPKTRKDGSTCYTATISARGTDIWIGTFNTLAEARKARKDAELKYWGFKIYDN